MVKALGRPPRLWRQAGNPGWLRTAISCLTVATCPSFYSRLAQALRESAFVEKRLLQFADLPAQYVVIAGMPEASEDALISLRYGAELGNFREKSRIWRFWAGKESAGLVK
ncbi:MAG TPA: hypothetical protein VJJ98_10115 [Sedimentisphaerales bacterium]|nr:hypothetical protein [Sedimentisphaerales bacterium]